MKNGRNPHVGKLRIKKTVKLSHTDLTQPTGPVSQSLI